LVGLFGGVGLASSSDVGGGPTWVAQALMSSEKARLRNLKIVWFI
jgi:hypothetical protein